MTTLNKNHPFVVKILKAEEIELHEGKITKEILEIRRQLKTEFPDLYSEYMDIKNQKQDKLRNKGKIEKSEAKTEAKHRSRRIAWMKNNIKNFGSDIK